MKKLEHIGIAVRNMDQAGRLFSRLLGRPSYKMEEVASEGVRTLFFDVAGVKIELLEPLNENSPIAKFIEKKGEGIHHLAFEVADIHESLRAYQEDGFEVVNTTPKKGADNKLIFFLHPRSTSGVLVELCQEDPDARKAGVEE